MELSGKRNREDDDSHRKTSTKGEHRGRENDAHKKRIDRDEDSPKQGRKDPERKKKKAKNQDSDEETETRRYEAEREKEAKKRKDVEKLKSIDRKKEEKRKRQDSDEETETRRYEAAREMEKRIREDERKRERSKSLEKKESSKKVKFSETAKGANRKIEPKTNAIVSEIVKLPSKLSKLTTTFNIAISKGEAKITYGSGDYLSKQAVDYCISKRVFERPIWPSKREATTKNPEIGALICRWVAKTSSKKKDADAGDKGKKKPFIRFADADESLRDEILMDTE